MRFQKGDPKLPNSGRKVGSINKRTSILEKCEAIGLDPFAKMAELASLGDTGMLKELCQYIEPKKQSVANSITMDQKTQEAAKEFADKTPEELEVIAKELIGQIKTGGSPSSDQSEDEETTH